MNLFNARALMLNDAEVAINVEAVSFIRIGSDLEFRQLDPNLDKDLNTRSESKRAKIYEDLS